MKVTTSFKGMNKVNLEKMYVNKKEKKGEPIGF